MSQVQKKKAVNFGGNKSSLGSPGARSPGAESPTGGLVSPLVKHVEVEEELLPEQPALFLPTGSPTLLIEQSPYHEFLRDFGMKYNFPERLPKCIVCVSARWVSDTGMSRSRGVLLLHPIDWALPPPRPFGCGILLRYGSGWSGKCTNVVV